MKLVPELVTKAIAEPLTLAEAKKQVEISSSDSTHDQQLQMMIEDARQQWERDTDSVCCFQTYKVRLRAFYDELKLPKSPVHSIIHIKYFNADNTLTTWPSNKYQLHVDEVRVAYLETIPAYAARWDAWEVQYKCGYSQDQSLVPAIAKRAMLLLVGYYFDANRGDNDRVNDLRAYEALVAKFMRSSYP
jgi:uncharacterized phiE125 gp8 family phage protein